MPEPPGKARVSDIDQTSQEASSTNTPSRSPAGWVRISDHPSTTGRVRILDDRTSAARQKKRRPTQRGLYQLASNDEVFQPSYIDPPPGGPLTIPSNEDGFDWRELPAGYPAPECEPGASNAGVLLELEGTGAGTAGGADPDQGNPDFDSALSSPSGTISIREDVRTLFPTLWRDAKATVTWKNVLVLGAAAGGAIALRDHADGAVRDWTAEHPSRWGSIDDFFRNIGEPAVQVPVMFGVYGYSVWKQEDKLHNFAKAMISAHALTSLTVVTLKGVTDTSRPDPEAYGGRWGFPSFHTGSTFAIAATVEEYYGWKAGLPAYALAGLVGWSRIDQREHDLSDVLFGAALGYVIGKSVARTHKEYDAKYEIRPYSDPVHGGTGVAIEIPY